MVLPGIRGDQRTPGGMPDSGGMGPGPMPGVPQNRNQSMGAGLEPPDPDKLQELFTQYTAGQITREDLVTQLHTFSEGQGGILGLLEGMQQAQGGSVSPVESMAGKAGAPSSIPIPSITPSPGAAPSSIPSLEEPLDARHQKISQMLQHYGLGRADADQMSTVLNPHVDPNRPQVGHGRYIEVDDSAVDNTPTASNTIDYNLEGGAFGPSAIETASTYGTHMTDYEWKRDNPDQEGGHFGPSATETASTYTTQPTNYEIERDADPILEGGHGGPSATETAQSSSLPAPAGQDVSTKGSSYVPTSGGNAAANIFGKATGDHLFDDSPTIVPTPVETPSALPTPTPVPAVVPDPKVVKPAADPLGDTVWASYLGSPDSWGQGGMPRSYGVDDFTRGKLGPDYMPEGQEVNKPDPLTGKMVRWPHEGVYNKFKEDLEAGWSGAYKIDGVPQVFTKDGVVPVEFIEFSSKDGMAKFGINGNPVAFAYSMSPDDVASGAPEVIHFASQNDLDNFRNTLTLPSGHSWDIEKGKFVTKTGEEAFKDNTIKETEVPNDWVLVDDGSGDAHYEDGAGNYVADKTADGIVPVEGADTSGSGAAAAPAAGGDAGTDPIMQDLSSVRADKESFRMFDRFLKQIDTSVFDADADLASTLAVAIKDLEIMAMSDTQRDQDRLYEGIINQLDRSAITARAKADRDLQQGAAIGSIDIEGVGATRTLASRIEQNKMILQQALLAGQIPEMDADGNYTLEFAKDTAGTPLQTLEARQQERELTMSETEKLDNKNINMAKVFGTWLPTAAKSADGTATPEAIQTLEAKKFGLTRSIHEAEVTGLIPRDMMGEHQLDQQEWRDKHRLGLPETLSAKRMAWEKDVATMNAETAKRKSFNEIERMNIDLRISENKTRSDEAIAAGKLAEAVEARKDATFIAKQKLDLEREKMKIDTLTALANPATYLFAVRYGLLEQIGGALGIDWGDDAISSDEVPTMVAPGTFPSMTDFQRATPSERQIMLAEVASSGGFTTDEAVRMIMEGAPGGRDIRRTSLVGVTR